jgi:hypothetical protein
MFSKLYNKDLAMIASFLDHVVFEEYQWYLSVTWRERDFWNKEMP